MKTNRKILLLTFSCCPSVEQMRCSSGLAAQGDCRVRMVCLLDRSRIFDSDGPAGVFPQEELVAGKVSDIRQRLHLLLRRSGLGWAQSSVRVGDPKLLLTRELDSWQPDLVIATRGWGHARRIARAARQAGIPVPEVMAVAPDHLLRKLLNALLPLSAEILHLPPDQFNDSFHGGHHHAAS